MNINLYPYSLYIVLICCICVIVCLCISLKHLSTLANTLQANKKTAQLISYHYTNIQIKRSALKEKKIESHKNDKYYKILIPILLAIYHTYQSDDSLKGFKGYRKATTNVLLHDVQHVNVLSKLRELF